jgi:hypothetical protein
VTTQVLLIDVLPALACGSVWPIHSLARSHSYRLTVHASVGGSAAIMITTSFMR